MKQAGPSRPAFLFLAVQVSEIVLLEGGKIQTDLLATYKIPLFIAYIIFFRIMPCGKCH